MALSAASIRRLRTTKQVALQVVSAATVYKGGYLALGSEHHATAGNRGRLYPFNDAAGVIPFGLMDGGGGSGTSQGADSVVGDATYNNMAAVILDGFVAENVSVTGTTAVTDVGKLVYMTDDDVMTLTRPTVGVPLGMVTAWRATTMCDVLFFPVTTIISIIMAGCGQAIWCLGTVFADHATGQVLTGIKAPYSGRIIDFYAICTVDPADVDVSIALNLEIGGVDVTGGVVTLAAADTKGLIKNGTAITGANKFSEGDAIDVEAVQTTAGTASDGLYTLFLEVALGPGL